MNVSADIRRSDLALLTLYFLPRTRSNWLFLVVVALGSFLYIVATKRPPTPLSFFIAAGASLVGGAAAVLIGVAISMCTMLLTVGNKSGVLGVHHYTLAPDGLHERTDVNETVQKWSGIAFIRNTGSYLVFQINSHIFYVLPRRAFSSAEQFNAFYEQAKSFKQAC